MAFQLHQRLLLLAAVLTAPFPARAITTTGQYTVTILGRVQHNYPGSAFNALCLNDNGVIAGFATVRVPDNFSQTIRGVLWQSSTPHYTILGTISENPIGLDSEAWWINNSGIAVGNSIENTSHGFVGVPVIFTANGIVDLGVKNASEGTAYCINNYGQVVGTLFWPVPSNATQAFLYQNGVMTLLGYPVPNPGYSEAGTINDSGLIVGAAVFAFGQTHHAAYYANGAWVDLGSLGPPNADFTAYASSVNDSGTIVGTWLNGNGSVNYFFSYQNGQMTNLNAPKSLAFSLALPVINNAGQIVLGNFIYQNGVWQDINDLDLGDGWKFSQAHGINNQGAIIGTVFREVNGTTLYRSALLTPVIPNQQAATRTP
jgi:probable HAF family extracellular repeat protein